jgi:hypothetical protein
MHRSPGEAAAALPARPAQHVHDVIADRKPVHARPDLKDLAGKFMPGYHRQLDERKPADAIDDVAVAHGASVNLEKDFAFTRLGRGGLLPDKVFGSAGLGQNYGLHDFLGE